MVGAGLLLMFVGFALVAPRGGVPGGASHRNVVLGVGRMMTTPGYQGEPGRRAKRIRLLIGFGMLVGGLGLIVAAG
jgi:hypothetical protein